MFKRVKCLLVLIFLSLFLSSCNLDYLFDDFKQPSNNFPNYNSSSSTKEVYDIGDKYFKFTGFEKYERINLPENIPTILVKGYCSYELFEVSAYAKMYDNNKNLLYSSKATRYISISKNEEFNIYIDVDNYDTLRNTTSVAVVFSGKSFTEPNYNVPNKTYNVTFVFNNGTNDKVVSVEKGNTVSKPTNPVKENYLFSGWYTDPYFINEYDFSKDVNNNLTLYAKYYVDYAALTNIITSKIMKSNVTVYAKNYNTFIGIETSSATSSGSGIIFYSDSKNYYLLTNNHVTVKNKDYDEVSYAIEDYRGNTYKGTLIYDSPKYDLAVMSFKKGNEQLGTVSLGVNNPEKNDEVVAVGQPKGQSNAVSFGKVLGYNTVSLSGSETYESNVEFPVIIHSAEINSGSSGGALLDVNLNIIGINYASGKKSDGTFVQAYAIPIEKVNEFLDLYFWK